MVRVDLVVGEQLPALGADDARRVLGPDADGAVVEEVARPEEGGGGGEGAQEHGAAHALRQYSDILTPLIDAERLQILSISDFQSDF